MNSPIKTADPRVFADLFEQFFSSISGCRLYYGEPIFIMGRGPIIKIFIMGGRRSLLWAARKGLEITGNRGFKLCLSTEMEEG